MFADDNARLVKMIAEYKRLRKLLHDLDVQAENVDRQLVDIERQLPDDDVDPGQPPED